MKRRYAYRVFLDLSPRRNSVVSYTCMRLLLFTTGVLLPLLLLEAVLRLIPYEGWREREKLSSRFHPYYSSPTPALEAFPQGDAQSDRAGYTVIHGRRISHQKQEGTRRVLFIGDSGTFGSGVAYEKSFPFVFEELHNKSNPPRRVEVINAGRRGLSTVGEIKLLEDDLLQFKPDVVVLGLFMANDLNFNLAHANVETLSFFETGILKAFYFLRHHSALCHFLYLRLLALNAHYRLVGSLGLQEAQWIPVEYRLIDDNGLSLVNYLHGEIASYKRPFSPLMRRAFVVLEDSFRRLQELSLQHNFSVAVVIIPTSSAVAGKLSMLTFPAALADLRKDGIDIDASELDVMAPTQEVMRLCDTLQLTCLNPTRAVASSLGLQAFLPGDDHLSLEGHRLLGESLARSDISR